MFTKLKKNKFIKSKGIQDSIVGTFTLLLAGGILAAIYITGIQNQLDVTRAVIEFQTERHTINLAQAMLSNEKLVYFDGEHYHRAIFDKEKLDAIMKMGDVGIEDFFSSNNELINTYPNSLTYFIVKDLESDEIWSATVWGPTTYEESAISNFATCMSNSAKIDANSIYSIIGAAASRNPLLLFLSAWDIWDLGKCLGVLGLESGDFFATKSDITSEGFPVAIKNGNEVHVGKMTVQLIEWL